MNTLDKCKTTFFLCLLLLLTSTVPYGMLWWQTQFVYDDTTFVEGVPQLAEVNSLGQSLRYSMQPTRPVADFFMALTHWLGGGSILGHRLSSALVHAAVTLLVYANLLILIPRTIFAGNRWLAFCIALLFSLHPLHSETVGISQFRSEMLAVLFLLCGTLIAQFLSKHSACNRWIKYALWALLALCLGLSQFSKEVFLVVSSVTWVGFYYFPERNESLIGKIRQRPAFFIFLLIITVLWGGLLWHQTKGDRASYSPHGIFVGPGAVSVSEQVPLAARALAEAGKKILTGTGLTTVRMAKRSGPLAGVGLTAAFGVIIGFLMFFVWLSRFGGWYFVWSLSVVVGTSIYLLIPNLNLGAEHYWYFSTLPVLSLIVPSVWLLLKRLSPNARQLTLALTVVFGLYFVPMLELRLSDMQNRLQFASNNLSTHPEHATAWTDVAVELMEMGSFRAADRYLRKAREISPADQVVLNVSFYYYVQTGNHVAAEKIFEVIRTSFKEQPKKLARLTVLMALTRARLGYCQAAHNAFLDAGQLDPENPLIVKEHQNFLYQVKNRRVACRPTPEGTG